MKKTVVVHQPDFLPHLAFFHRLLSADLFVVLDTVQYRNRGWTNRDRIKTPAGSAWLTVSVKKAPQKTPIRDIELVPESAWRRRNLDLIGENYRAAPHYAEFYPRLEKFYASECRALADFNLRSIDLLEEAFGLKVPRILASELGCSGTKNNLIVDALTRVGATHYLSGLGARDYFDPEPYRKGGFEVVWQSFAHPRYPQLHGDFTPYLSSIDLLLNCGMAHAKVVLRSC